MHRVEQLGGEGADIVEIELQRVQGRRAGRREPLAGEFRSKSHSLIVVRRAIEGTLLCETLQRGGWRGDLRGRDMTC